MELFLNLCWLTLVLPAYWLWRSEPACSKTRLHRFRSLVLLGCVLTLLFPVISATDDLHAMRPEMEESTPGKRMVQAAATDKSSCRSSRLGSAPPALLSIFSFHCVSEARGLVDAPPLVIRAQVHLGTNACRAPPVSCLT